MILKHKLGIAVSFFNLFGTNIIWGSNMNMDLLLVCSMQHCKNIVVVVVEIWAASRAILLEWCHHEAEDLVRDQEVDEYHQHENLSCEKYEKTS